MVRPVVTLLSVFVGCLLLAAVVVVMRLRFEQPHQRQVVRVRHVLGPAVLVLVAMGLGVTALGATEFELVYSVVEEVDQPGGEVPVNEASVQRLEVSVAAMPGTIYMVRGWGVTVESYQRRAGTLEVMVRLPAVQEPGTYRAMLRLTPYAATLPRGLLAVLYDHHPLSAMIASTGALVVPVYLLARLLVDGEKPVFRTRHRWLRRRLGE